MRIRFALSEGSDEAGPRLAGQAGSDVRPAHSHKRSSVSGGAGGMRPYSLMVVPRPQPSQATTPYHVPVSYQ